MNLDKLKQVYRHVQTLKNEGNDVEITVKVMLFTGLGNEALTKLIVNDVLFDQEMLRYNAGIVNSKHKVQFFPLPPALIKLTQNHIKENQLQPDDSLLYGLKGQPLQNKQLNRITNKICQELGWEGGERVTPHGFRATIATLIDERGIGTDTIKFMLGHSEKENIHYYLRRDQRKINLLRTELTKIEQELEDGLTQSPDSILPSNSNKQEGRHANNETSLNLDEDTLIQLLDTHPKLAIQLIKKGYGSTKQNSFPDN
ncbi:site-specific integrase [Virgibacillus subterraneus]|nr:site-specific integrase [Virgibacillus subterraneus]